MTTWTGAVLAEGQAVQRPDTAVTLAVSPVGKGDQWLCGCYRQQERAEGERWKVGGARWQQGLWVSFQVG